MIQTIKTKGKLAANCILNKAGHQSTAASSFNIEDDYKDEDGNLMVECYSSLSISDCSRQININLNFGSERAYKNVLHKLNQLKLIIEFSEEAIKEQYPRWVESEKQYKLREKVKKKKKKLKI